MEKLHNPTLKQCKMLLDSVNLWVKNENSLLDMVVVCRSLMQACDDKVANKFDIVTTLFALERPVYQMGMKKLRKMLIPLYKEFGIYKPGATGENWARRANWELLHLTQQQ